MFDVFFMLKNVNLKIYFEYDIKQLSIFLLTMNNYFCKQQFYLNETAID